MQLMLPSLSSRELTRNPLDFSGWISMEDFLGIV